MNNLKPKYDIYTFKDLKRYYQIGYRAKVKKLEKRFEDAVETHIKLYKEQTGLDWRGDPTSPPPKYERQTGLEETETSLKGKKRVWGQTGKWHIKDCPDDCPGCAFLGLKKEHGQTGLEVPVPYPPKNQKGQTGRKK